MRKIVVSEFLTLDGVMQAPGGKDEDTEGGFEYGGWQMPYGDAIGGAAVTEVFDAAGTLLLGRKTYDIFAAYWPTAPTSEPLALVINSMTKYVVSTTKRAPGWQNAYLISDNAVEEIKKMKQMEGKNILVIGSGDLAQTLMSNDLVDEYHLMIHPLILGRGKKLFRDNPKKELTLVKSVTTTTGVLIGTYAAK